MVMTKDEPFLQAEGLVNKHRTSTKLYAVKQVAEMMRNHGLTVADIEEHLSKPSQYERMRELKAKLFKPQAEVVEDGDSVSDPTDGAGETEEPAPAGKTNVPKAKTKARSPKLG